MLVSTGTMKAENCSFPDTSGFVNAGRLKASGCPSPAIAARMMPPPSTGRFPRLPPYALASHAPLHTSSTPMPQQRKKRRRAAQHVLLTQESPVEKVGVQSEHASPCMLQRHGMQKCCGMP